MPNADKTVLENHMKISGSMIPIMLLSVLPFTLFSWVALAVLAPRLRDFCTHWLFWNFDSMMLSMNMLA